MNEQARDSLEERSRTLFRESVDNVDMRVRSRLTQARTAAIEAAGTNRRDWALRKLVWTPAIGLTAAAVLGLAVWFGPLEHRHAGAPTDAQASLEDLDIVASADEGSGDAMEMLQDDIDFYDWAEKAGNSGPAA